MKTTPDKVVTKNNVRWWTPELTALRKKVRKARKDFQVARRSVSNVGEDRLDRTEVLREEWTALNRSYKRKIIEAKKKPIGRIILPLLLKT